MYMSENDAPEQRVVGKRAQCSVSIDATSDFGRLRHIAQKIGSYLPKITFVNALRCLIIGSATMAPACASAPPKAPAAPPPEKAVQVAPQAAPLPALPAAFTQKGVAVKIDGLWQAADGEILGVSGTAKNVTASDLRFCQISLAFLDQTGAKLDDAKASTKTLKSAQIWHFQAALGHPSQTPYASITPEKVIAIPVKVQKADLASLQ